VTSLRFGTATPKTQANPYLELCRGEALGVRQLCCRKAPCGRCDAILESQVVQSGFAGGDTHPGYYLIAGAWVKMRISQKKLSTYIQ
jgi:hypothetical protein